MTEIGIHGINTNVISEFIPNCADIPKDGD